MSDRAPDLLLPRIDGPATTRALGATLLTVTAAPAMFSSWLPSYFTIRSFALDGSQSQVAAKLAHLRSGYRPATLFTVGFGGAMALLARSWVPAVAGVAVSYLMVRQYEAAIPEAARLEPDAMLRAMLLPEPAAALPGPREAT